MKLLGAKKKKIIEDWRLEGSDLRPSDPDSSDVNHTPSSSSLSEAFNPIFGTLALGSEVSDG
jgi:hypothetical protein